MPSIGFIVRHSHRWFMSGYALNLGALNCWGLAVWLVHDHSTTDICLAFRMGVLTDPEIPSMLPSLLLFQGRWESMEVSENSLNI